MGDPYTDYPAGPWVGEPVLGDRPLLYGAYLGCSVLALALLALGRQRRLETVLGATAVFFLLVSFGRFLGLHAGLRVLLPPLAFMRGPEKYLAIVTASVALLAGLGCARLLGNERPRKRTLVIPFALAALALAAGRFPIPMVEPVRSAAISTLVFALATVGLAFFAGRGPRWAGPLLVGLVFVDLARSVFALQNFGPPALLGEEPAAARAILADARARGLIETPRIHRPAVVDSAITQAGPPTSVAEVQRNLVNTLIDNHAGTFGLGCVPGYDAALPSTFSSLMQAHTGPSSLRLIGAEYVILPQAIAPSPDLQALLDPAPGVRLFRLANVLPRVYLARARSILPDPSAKVAIFDPEIVAGRSVVLAPTPAAPSTVAVGQTNGDPPGQCRLSGYANTRIEADCDASSAALAIFLEQYDVGWSATVDGQAAPLLRANLAMRAVPVPAGRHHIVLDFAVPGLRRGILISMAGLVILLALLLVGRKSSIETKSISAGGL
jgi:hypothetical protein